MPVESEPVANKIPTATKLSQNPACNKAQGSTATTTAQARAGDQGAAGKLSSLAEALLAAGKNNAVSGLDYARLQGQTAASLQTTLNTVARSQGIALPADMMLSPQRTTTTDNSAALLAEISAMRKEIEGLRAESQATAQNTYRTQKLLDRGMPDGDALATRVAA